MTDEITPKQLCGVVLAVEDRRGYVFRLYGDITVNVDLREVIRSIELDPETCSSGTARPASRPFS